MLALNLLISFGDHVGTASVHQQQSQDATACMIQKFFTSIFIIKLKN